VSSKKVCECILEIFFPNWFNALKKKKSEMMGCTDEKFDGVMEEQAHSNFVW